MKVVILAGGLGSRISEETGIKPKPMIEVGGNPLLWHLMKIYSAYGLNEFIICLGYKGSRIQEYFQTENSQRGSKNQPWVIHLVETGESTQTGGRLKRVRDHLGEDDFCFTYGDGLGNIDIKKLIEFHRSQKALATVTAVHPPGRFGILQMEGPWVAGFREKPQDERSWINGGFFVLSPRVIDFISNDETIWEEEPMQRLVKERQLASYRHEGFWHPMDTLRDKNYLESLWNSGQAPWKVWR